jgi:diguanylate cyclase (GGDEF)-like protein
MSALIDQAGIWMRQRVIGANAWPLWQSADAAQLHLHSRILLGVLLAQAALLAFGVGGSAGRVALGLTLAAVLGLYAYCNALLERQLQQRCAQAANSITDEVTGLARREYLLHRLTETLEHARRNGTLVGIITISLDNWAQLAALNGTANCALMLRETAVRIQNCLRQTDLAARVNTAEFALVLCNLKSRRGMETVIRRLQLALNESIALPNGQGVVRATVGAAVFPFDAELPDDLFEAARADAETLRFRSPRALLQALG